MIFIWGAFESARPRLSSGYELFTRNPVATPVNFADRAAGRRNTDICHLDTRPHPFGRFDPSDVHFAGVVPHFSKSREPRAALRVAKPPPLA